jgi:nitrate/nitrite-specific signal transduction histidine kinase
VNGKDTLPGTDASLSYQQNDIQFYFSTPVFYDPSSVSFRYRLTGADKEWRVTAPGERTIRYSALPPGDYKFTFYAIDNSGVQQKQLIHFPFSIEKPFWRTWWFIVLVNTFLFVIVYIIIRNRINQKLRLELMRRSISNDLHDDIGATLSSVNFYIDLAQHDKQNTEYLRHIKDNVNQVISSLDDLVWSINPKNDNTGQFINRMKDYAIPFLKAARIHCHFHYDPKVVNLKLDLLTKRHLYLLFKEVVNNVAKHALCRNCTIELVHDQENLRLVVSDDGKGFNVVEVDGSRSGLFSMQERVRLLNGEMEIRSVKKEGSRVAVTIPL